MKIRLLLLMLFLCGCDVPAPPGEPDVEPMSEQVSIPYLKAFCLADAYVVEQAVFVEGRVTANDLHGEFVGTVVVEDAYGGIEVVFDGETDLYQKFPLGSLVRVYAGGQTLRDYGGKIRLEAGIEKLQRVGSEEGRTMPNVLNVSDMEMKWVSRFVRFDDLRFAEEEVGLNFCDYDRDGRVTTTERHLVDRNLDTLILRTPWTCTYAEEPIPDGTGAFRGILDYFNGTYQLRIVNREMFI